MKHIKNNIPILDSQGQVLQRAKIKCMFCGDEFLVHLYLEYTAKYCNRKCKYSHLKQLSYDDEYQKYKLLKSVIVQQNNCWEWQKSKNTDGYANWKYKGKQQHASRISYLLFIGDIPINKIVCHSCDNRKCVNPNHLFLGTRKENTQDMVNKDRHTRGERSPNSKTTNNIVIEIRELFSRGMKQSEIAKVYGFNPTFINRIVLRKTWRHI